MPLKTAIAGRVGTLGALYRSTHCRCDRKSPGHYNGDVVRSEKYEYKLRWLAALRDYLHEHNLKSDKLVVSGDLNIAPAETDVAQPELWGGSVLFHPQMRDELQQLLDTGLVDTFRAHHPAERHYSWWDYRNSAFPRNDGLRIDHILVRAERPRAMLQKRRIRERRDGLLSELTFHL